MHVGIGDEYIRKNARADDNRIYNVLGILPFSHDYIGGAGGTATLGVQVGSLSARLIGNGKDDGNCEGNLAFRLRIEVLSDALRYPAGTEFVLYRVDSWKSGKVWASPLRYFQREMVPFSPLP